MFKKTRWSIFALIMVVATALITLMLTVVYSASSRYSLDRSYSLLESYAENELSPAPDPVLSQMPSSLPSPSPDENHGFRGESGRGMKDDHDKMFRLSTFYSVLYDANGHVSKVNFGDGSLYSEAEILTITSDILRSGETRGVYSKLPFLVRTGPAGTLVALMDATMETDNSLRLFEYSLMAGLGGWVIILILAWFFSRKIVRPLEENDARQKQFISDAGHELKTPISVISANADLLALEIGDNKWLSNIQYENERMGVLVRQLLELVRAENNQSAKEDLDLSRLVSGGSLPFESVAFEKGLVLNTEIEEKIHVQGNQSQLSQLISILIDNAIEHGKGGKEITVRLENIRHQAVLSVINHGDAIPEAVKERLFERFYRMDEARTDESGHYGLGLAIAKAVTLSHAGHIDVICENGLIEFKVTLPLS